MLQRSFKGGKCKTSLKLAVARIKLLKNKRDVQLRQMKRDLAQLLESGQEQTARIRVEHVVREEKTMAAYDLIEIYCELIVARLPIIESQKTCPIDLKEAITSVVFASPRCADVPELLDVRKQFTAKYGKEFIASALDLRPDCGVNRNMVEKLSARTPDGETKIKILTAIAKEHNINWEHKDLEENELKPPEDLLNGPNTFETARKTTVESPNVQPQSMAQKYDSSISISQKRSSINSQDYASVNTSSMARTAASHSQSVASETGRQGRDFRDSSSEEGNAFPMRRENWNMDFKDATEAAQAAAESAERASMAARAAAELSSGGKYTRQHAPQFHESFGYSVQQGEGPRTSADPSLREERVNQDPVNMTYDPRTGSSHNVDQRMQNQRGDKSETENLGRVHGRTYHGYDSSNRRSGQSGSPASNIASVDDERPVASLNKKDHYNKKNSPKVESNPNWESRKGEKGRFHDEVRIHNQSSDSEAESVDQQYKSRQTDYAGFPLEEEIRKRSTKSTSFSSRLNTDGDDANLNSEIHNYGNDTEDHSFDNTDIGKMRRDTKQPSSSSYHGVVFDEYGTNEDRKFSAEGDYNGHEFNSYASSPFMESPSRPSPAADSWTNSKHRSSSIEENYGSQSVSNMEPHSPSGFLGRLSKVSLASNSEDLPPAAFDDSDGLDSESGEDIENYKHSGRTDPTSLSHKQNVFTGAFSESTESDWGHEPTRSSFLGKDTAEAKEKPWSRSSFDYSESEDGRTRRNQETVLNFGGESERTYSGFGSTKSSFIEKEAAVKNRKPLPSSSDDSESEGISEKPEKHYGHADLSNVKAFHGRTSSRRNLDRESGIVEKKLPLQTSIFSSAKEDQSQNNFSASRSPHAIKDLEYPNYSSSEIGQGLNLGRLTGGIRNKGYARRTYSEDPSVDASPQSSRQSAENTPTFNEQTNVSSKFKSSASSDVPKEFSSRSPKTYFDSDSDDSEPLPRQTARVKGHTSGKLTYRARNSPKEYESKEEDSNRLESDNYNYSVSQPEVPLRKGNSRSRLQKTNPSVEYLPSKPIPEQEAVSSGSAETPVEHESSGSSKTLKPLISNEGSASRENSLKKAGHVHPKLPDYDTFAAHFESLRSNRRSP